MEILLIIVSIVLIALVLLQSNKASEAGQIITGGGNSMLMGQMKERGAEKFITRLTYATGFLFIILSMIMGL